MPTTNNERVLCTPAVSFHPYRQCHKSRVTDRQTDQTRPKFGVQVVRIIVHGKNGLPALPQHHQIVVCFASQCFKVGILGNKLSIEFSRKAERGKSNLVHSCWTLRVVVDLGSKLADHPQLARICGYMDIETFHVLVGALPPVL